MDEQPKRPKIIAGRSLVEGSKSGMYHIFYVPANTEEFVEKFSYHNEKIVRSLCGRKIGYIAELLFARRLDDRWASPRCKCCEAIHLRKGYKPVKREGD